MGLYSSDNNLLKTQDFSYYASGKFSNIYKKDDILLKIYNIDCGYRYIISNKLFNFLKKKEIANLVKLFQSYHRYTDFYFKFLRADAYTMGYVNDKKIKLIDMDKEYLNDVLAMLEETLEELSENKILIEDSHRGNILFTEGGVTILDPDQFIIMKLLSKKSIYEHNKKKILFAINDTLLNEKILKTNDGCYCFVTSTRGKSLTYDMNNYFTEKKIIDSINKYV